MKNTLSAHDILSQASGEISYQAEAVGIDYEKLRPQITKHRTEYKRGIELDKKYRGKVYAYVNFKTTPSGIEYPAITLGTHKHGGVKEFFNGYQWLIDNGHVSERGSSSAKPQPKPVIIPKSKADDSQEFNKKLNAYNACKQQFDALPELISVEGNYFGNKGFVDANLIGANLRYGKDNKGDFVIFAVGNGEQSITGFQKIYPDVIEYLNTNKLFVFYPIRDNHGNITTRKQGSYAVIGDASNKATPTYIAEGYATALSVSVATGCPCIVALDAGNLKPVVDSLIKRGYTDLVIAADNDVHDGGGNVGAFNAIQAARYTTAKITVPELDGKKCDFDDVRINLGIASVESQLKNILFNHQKPLEHYCQLIKYAPPQQLKKIITQSCSYAGACQIATTTNFKTVYRCIYAVASNRGYSGLTIRYYLKKYFKKNRLAKIQAENGITDFSGSIRHDCTGMDNVQIMGLVDSIGGGIICDTRGMGAGKTELMKLVADKALLRTTTGVSHGDVKRYHETEGGSAAAWGEINNSPALFNALLKELEGLERGELQKTAYICHRVSLTKSASERLGINYYDDTCPTHYWQSLAACVNSMPKFQVSQVAQVLFIDEIRQTLEHVLNGKVNNRLEVYNELIAAIKNAGLVICADADFNDLTLAWLKSITNKPVHVITQDAVKTGKNIIELADSGAVLDNARNELQNGGNIWIATDSTAQARQVAMHLLPDDDSKLLFLTAENKGDPEQAAFLASPDAESKKYRVIIHTPVISSGVSIVNNHFTKVYAIFCNVIAPNSMLQTIGRIRTAKEIHICFKSAHIKNRPINEQDFIDGTVSSRGRYAAGTLVLSDLDCLRLNRIATGNAALNDYRQYFIVLAQLKGYSFKQSDMVGVKIKGLASATKAQKIEDILLSDSIDSNQALSIDRLSNPTQEQSDQLHRYNVVKMIGVSKVTDADVDFYQNGGLAKVINFELISQDDVELKDADRLNQETRNKISSKTFKKIIITDAITAIGDRSITKIEAADICGILKTHHQEIAASDLGNYKSIPKQPVKRLGDFLSKFGYELVAEKLIKGQPRSYKLAVNEQVRKYAKARVDTEWTKNNNPATAQPVAS